MNKESETYYINQVQYGSGIPYFQGVQYQRGHGFFSSIFQNILKPLGMYFGKQVLSTGVNVGKDILEGQNLKESLKKNAKITGKNMFNDGIARATRFAQTGTGKRRRRRRKAKNSKIKSKPIKKKGRKKNKSVSKKKPKKKRSRKRVKSNFAHLF